MAKKDNITEIIKEIENEKKDKIKETSKIIKEFLIIEIESNFFALQLEYLREVFDLSSKNDIVPIPFTPEYIMGIINVRGEIIPVISILKILEIKGKNNDYIKTAIIDEKFKIALPFTDLVDLKAIDIKNIKTIKDASKKTKDQFITQEFEYDGKTIGILDLLKIYSSDFLK